VFTFRAKMKPVLTLNTLINHLTTNSSRFAYTQTVAGTRNPTEAVDGTRYTIYKFKTTEAIYGQEHDKRQRKSVLVSVLVILSSIAEHHMRFRSCLEVLMASGGGYCACFLVCRLRSLP
jgi:hypothetical protein